jgi:hypothetical protein
MSDPVEALAAAVQGQEARARRAVVDMNPSANQRQGWWALAIPLAKRFWRVMPPA